MAPVTQLVHATLKPGTEIEPLYKIFETLKAQPGNQVVRGSRVHENPDQFRLAIDWDSIDAHHAFSAATAAHEEYMGQVAAHIAGPPKVIHAELSPFPPVVLDQSPVTELLVAYFAPASGGDEAGNLAAARQPAAGLTGAGFAGSTGLSAAGWTVERDVEFKGEPTRALVVLLGWESVEAHEAAHETDAYQKITAEFQAAVRGVKGHEVSHVSAKIL
ncbi:hypothetical protein M426DRAFT_24728 [Hypoxylon sp. CI-4A]|nr:hypothetical protein M426DRAFT_24728 [Hypoxylon sp. CI-4A]